MLPQAQNWFLLDIGIYFPVKDSLLLELWVCCADCLIPNLPSSPGQNTDSVGLLFLDPQISCNFQVLGLWIFPTPALFLLWCLQLCLISFSLGLQLSYRIIPCSWSCCEAEHLRKMARGIRKDRRREVEDQRINYSQQDLHHQNAFFQQLPMRQFVR